jgi:4-amino-4-deoxy-L-arabinose transferase-like glycosyltransferase
VPVLFSDMLPWSLCLPAIVYAWLRDRRSQEDPSLRVRTLLLLWIAVTVVLFSLSQTKQDLYIFPIVAAVAALGGDWVARSVRLQPDQRSAWFTATFVVIGMVMAALGGVVIYLFSGDRPVYLVSGARAVRADHDRGRSSLLLSFRGCDRGLPRWRPCWVY